MKKVLGLLIPTIATCTMIGITFYLLTVSSRVMAAPIPYTPTGEILVTTLEDELNEDGDCSLREAIEAANTNMVVDFCGSGNVLTDTITFDVSGTITLGSQLFVTARGPLMIDGAGTITVNGSGTDRLIWIYADSLLKLENLTLTGGHFQGDGGGIFNSGVLYISGCILSNNIATGPGGGGGIYNAGSLFITSSIVSGNHALEVGARGGGILNFEFAVQAVLSNTILSDNSAMNGGGIHSGISLEIINSTISNNSALRGGGIYNSASLDINGSTLSGNDADIEGGGINNFGLITMTNSTLSGNIVLGDYGDGGAIYNHSVPQAMVHILNSTLTQNSSVWSGGGIRNSAFANQFILANSIISDNLPANCSGELTDGNNNIENSDTCGFSPANSSHPNTNPVLGILQQNGGASLTHALTWNSPAIDAGDEAQCPSFDQRGSSRPLDGDNDGVAVCDIGAYEREYQPIVLLPLVLK